MTAELVHPQPVGAFGFPAGLLLIGPGAPEDEQARQDLVEGRLPESWPTGLTGHAFVHVDDLEAALAAFGEPGGTDPVRRYNRWVLDPAADDAAAVRAALPASARPLVDVVAYTIGLPDLPTEETETLPGEIAALVLAARATVALEEGSPVRAADLLETGADAASSTGAQALSAVLRGNAGTLLREHGDPARARDLLGEAAAALAGTDLREVRAELLHARGSIAQEAAASGTGDARTLLQDAMQDYYVGLQLVTEQSAPYLWASLQMNLATAHLASPMSQASDQLRLGIATQALRACRRVLNPTDYPGPWSTATLNLANALVYTPSTHQADNLVEAVELYEEVLESGVRDRDPLGRARVLANQGNVLSHLGIFEEARSKLVEARYLFESQLDHDSATAVRSMLDEIARTLVKDPVPADAGLADLARQAEQMARMPQLDPGPPPKPTVTVLPPGSAYRYEAPTGPGGGGAG
jgi:tetratricopeptide (TPR) repeat protein